MVAARAFTAEGLRVRVLLMGAAAELKGDAAEAWRELVESGCKHREVLTEAELDEEFERMGRQNSPDYSPDLIIDALVGTGFKGPLRGLPLKAVEWVRKCAAESGKRVRVVAVDLPSGWEADSIDAEAEGQVCPADAVLTFTAPKSAHLFGHLTREWKQSVVVAEIGTPEEIFSSLKLKSELKIEWAGAAVQEFQRPRAWGANKGNFGHVLVVGGSAGRSGAAGMAALGALCSGAGLVTAAVPRSVQALVAGLAPELMTIALEETSKGGIDAGNLASLTELMERKTVMAIGPGIGKSEETAQFVLGLLGATKLPVVVDADALNLLAAAEEVQRGFIRKVAEGRVMVVTPHPGEMARLCGCSIAEVQAKRLETARRFADEHGVVVVLKGARTVIAEPGGERGGEAVVNTSGNPGMAKGGSGDLLTGMVAGLLAQQIGEKKAEVTVLKAVSAAVWLHGLAGDFAVRGGNEHTFVASDILNELSRAFRYHPEGGKGYVWIQGMRRA
jgi:NAD(P)H-hydrate epimerase